VVEAGLTGPVAVASSHHSVGAMAAMHRRLNQLVYFKTTKLRRAIDTKHPRAV
jgi:hypothetical protein